MYAEKKGIDLRKVEVQLSEERIHAEDCRDCERKEGLILEIRSRIRLEGDLTDAQRRRLMQIAARCPVHRTLTSEVKIRISEF